MKKFKILYAEDDATIAFLTKDSLEEKYDIIHCSDGEVALKTFQNTNFDLCLLDIMMPKIDGFTLAEVIRKNNQSIPIIFLSAKTLKEDRIKGLKIGADDYIIKPFSIEELELKIAIFLRRSQKEIPKSTNLIYTIGKYTFDANNYLIYSEDQKIILTQRESDLLQLFLDNKNKVLKREDILLQLWGSDDYFLGRSLDVFISKLRKIMSTEENISIQNLHGIGFQFLEKNKNT